MDSKLNFFMEKTEFPRDEVYDALTEILTQRSFVITPIILKTLSTYISESAPFPVLKIDRAFVNLLLYLDQMIKISEIMVREQLFITDKREIFRENSLAANLVQNTFRIAGQEFIVSIFAELVQQLANSNDNIEVDPVQAVGEVGDIKQNGRLLSAWSTKFLDAVINNMDKFPLVLKDLCLMIQREVVNRYSTEPDKEDIARNAVNSLLMLRFIALVIFSPAQYKVVKEGAIKTAKQKRNLVLVSKVIQAYANGTVFRNSFEVLNDDIMVQHARYNAFIKDLLSETTNCKVCVDVPPRLTAFSSPALVEDASIVIKYLQNHVDPDKVVKDSLQVFYPHIVTNTGKFTVEEMMEMLKCFTRLKWIIATDWFSSAQAKPLGGSNKKLDQMLRLLKNAPQEPQEKSIAIDANPTSGFKSTVEWIETCVQRSTFTILIFYRGFFCTGCKQHLGEWSRLSNLIRQYGGNIYGITSESAASTLATRKKWGLNYNLISDPQVRLAENYGVHVEETAAAGWNLLGDYGTLFSQPAIVVMRSSGEVVYYWKQNPTFANIMGGTGRPVPIEVLSIVMDTLFDEFDDSMFPEEDSGSIGSEDRKTVTPTTSTSSFKNGLSGSRSVGGLSPSASNRSLSSMSDSSTASTMSQEEFASTLTTMDKLSLHRIITNGISNNDQFAVNIAEEVKNNKKSIRESKKRLKKLAKSAGTKS